MEGYALGQRPSDCLKAYGRSPWERYRTHPGGRGENPQLPVARSADRWSLNTPWQEDVWDASYPPHTDRWEPSWLAVYHSSREEPLQNVLTPEFRVINFGFIDGDHLERAGTVRRRWRPHLVTR